MGLRREFLIKGFDDKLVRAYYDYMVDIAVLFGAEKPRAIREMKQIIEFEMQLANVSTRRQEYISERDLNASVADFSTE